MSKASGLLPPEAESAVESYDPETEFVAAACYPEDMILPSLMRAEAFAAGHAPQPLS